MLLFTAMAYRQRVPRNQQKLRQRIHMYGMHSTMKAPRNLPAPFTCVANQHVASNQKAILRD